jgi:uncharacterized protein (TIGR02145 family)
MKNLVTLVLLAMTTGIFAQAPGVFNYQAVITNQDGSSLSMQPVSFRVSLLQGEITGTALYTETQQDTTNSYGLVILNIGLGTPVQGEFAKIDWSKGPYFLKLELDPAGGSDYHHMGTSQLLSVPYSLFAGTVKEVRAPADLGPDESIFQVTNANGDVLFGVYNSGVRIVLDEIPGKGGRGGFVVGGRTGKGIVDDYLVLNRDTALFTIDDITPGKGGRGGFAVGGRGGSKGNEFQYMVLNGDSTNFYLHQDPSGSSTAFNIVGVNPDNTTTPILAVTKDSTNVSTNLNVTKDVNVGGGVTTDLTLRDTGWITDSRDGQKYRTVIIGTQTWMAENLRAINFQAGPPIMYLNATSDTTWKNIMAPARTYYNADSVLYYKKYGGLYNWYAASAPGNACPLGWHVPSLTEWQTLITFAGTATVAGGALKSIEDGIWNAPNTGASDVHNFAAMPGGYATPYEWLGNYGYYWTTTPSSATTAYCIVFNYDGSHVVIPSNPIKQMGYSIRCVKN